MKKYVAYGIGAALVDTEIKVQDEELAQMNVDKGMMTLVDEERPAQLLAGRPSGDRRGVSGVPLRRDGHRSARSASS